MNDLNGNPIINELAKALALAQGEMHGAKADSENPFFKSKYADLQSVWEAIRGPFTKNGLSVVQPTDMIDGKLVVRTILLHSSGQSIQGITPVRAKDESPQAMGSAISYARRYGLSSMCGVFQTDDDAEHAQGRYNANTHIRGASEVGHKLDEREPQPVGTAESKPANEQQASKANHQAQAPKAKTIGPSENQLKRLYALKNKAKWTDQQVSDYMRDKFNVKDRASLGAQQYQFFTDLLDKSTSFIQAMSGPGIY